MNLHGRGPGPRVASFEVPKLLAIKGGTNVFPTPKSVGFRLRTEVCVCNYLHAHRRCNFSRASKYKRLYFLKHVRYQLSDLQVTMATQTTRTTTKTVGAKNQEETKINKFEKTAPMPKQNKKKKS